MEQDHEENEEQEQEQKAPSQRGRRKGQSYGKKKKSDTLNIYIYKVLKQIHPDMGISKLGMNVINSFLLDVMDKLASEAANAVKYTNKNTMDSRAIECAVRLCLPGEFAKHAQRDAKAALEKYCRNTGKAVPKNISSNNK